MSLLLSCPKWIYVVLFIAGVFQVVLPVVDMVQTASIESRHLNNLVFGFLFLQVLIVYRVLSKQLDKYKFAENNPDYSPLFEEEVEDIYRITVDNASSETPVKAARVYNKQINEEVRTFLEVEEPGLREHRVANIERYTAHLEVQLMKLEKEKEE